MAKNSNKGKKAGKRPRKTRVPRPVGSSVVTRDDNVLAGHWDMVSNPCFANLGESAYRGQSGFTQRFTSIRTVTAGTDTAFLALYNPATASLAYSSRVDDSTTFAPVYNIAVTGQTFLSNTADSWRCVGFCVDVDYVGTELNRSGVVAAGTYIPSLIPAGVLTNVLNVAPMFTNVTRTSDKTMTAKWFPGVGNERYENLTENNDLIFGNDTTGLAILGTNMPPGIQLRFVETAIYEWVPKQLQGMSFPSATAGKNPLGAFERIHDMANRDPSFSHSFLAGAQHKLAGYAGEVGAGLVDLAYAGGKYAARQLARSAYRAAPMLLTL